MKRITFTCLLAAAILLLPDSARAQTASDFERRISELEEKMRLVDPAFGRETSARDLSSRLQILERKLAEVLAAKQPASSPKPPLQPQTQPQPAPPVVASVVQPAIPPPVQLQSAASSDARLPLAGYVDLHVNKNAGESFRPDLQRFVLLVGHSFSDRIKFWGELEVEHALVEGGEETGEVAVEQAYMDFLIKPSFNIRAGLLLAPVGIINERHEPPSFNGVERPFVETQIIPTTWREFGVGLTGDLGRGFRYRAYLTSSLDGARFSAETGISDGRTAGFSSSFRNPAKVGRLEYGGIRRLTLGASFYSGHTGFNLPGLNPRVSLVDFDGRYRYRRLDLRGLYARNWVSRAGDLNAQLERTLGVNPNIARQMRGYYLEPAFHILPRLLTHDVILFSRYEKYNTQYRMPEGYLPLSQFDRSAWASGITWKPHADVAIKFDYIFNRNKSLVVRPVNSMNLGIGWWF